MSDFSFGTAAQQHSSTAAQQHNSKAAQQHSSTTAQQHSNTAAASFWANLCCFDKCLILHLKIDNELIRS